MQVDDDALIAGMVANGTPELVARIIASFPAAAREGLLGSVSSAVEDLTGAPARSLRDVVAAGLVGTAGD